MRNLTLVFDLDGTLVDTAPDLMRTANHVLGKAGLAPVASDVLRPQISFGARRMIEAGLASHDAKLSATEVDALFEAFLVYYAANISVESRPFPGVAALLDEAAAAGAKLAVCTNKRESLSRLLLGDLGLADRFVAIAGRDTFPVCKPHPDHLLGAIRMAGGDPSAAIMVGDSDVDIQTAKAAGIPVIGVTFGYTDVPVTELGADAVIDGYDGFHAALSRIRRA